jgi:hypothetical protein
VRPLLLLDVDGVLSPTGVAVPPGFQRRSTPEYSVVIHDAHRGWLHALAKRFDLTWATSWGNAANRVYGDLLGLPLLPVVPLGQLPRSGTRKLAAIQAYVGDRTLAWVDDELYDDAEEWARRRLAPTLLVRTRASIGLSQDDVERLLAFAQRLPDP